LSYYCRIFVQVVQSVREEETLPKTTSINGSVFGISSYPLHWFAETKTNIRFLY
jgi:hypothetical protein